MYVYIYIYIYICMCVCMYVCMYVYIYIYIYIHMYSRPPSEEITRLAETFLARRSLDYLDTQLYLLCIAFSQYLEPPQPQSSKFLVVYKFLVVHKFLVVSKFLVVYSILEPPQPQSSKFLADSSSALANNCILSQPSKFLVVHLAAVVVGLQNKYIKPPQHSSNYINQLMFQSI